MLLRDLEKTQKEMLDFIDLLRLSPVSIDREYIISLVLRWNSVIEDLINKKYDEMEA